MILAQMVKDGHAPSSSQMQALGDDRLFAQKKAAMTIGDFSALATLENEGIQYGVAPVPAPRDTEPWVPVWTDRSASLPRASTHKRPKSSWPFWRPRASGCA